MSGGTSAAASFLYGRKHRCKAKNVMTIISLMPKVDLRCTLLQAAGEVFIAFEAQFAKVIDADGSWLRAMEKLAVEAMDRSVNHIDFLKSNSTDKDIDFSSDFIIQSIIEGNSKKGLAATCLNFLKLDKLVENGYLPNTLKNKWPKSGHSLKCKEQNWKICDMFQSVGIVILNTDGNEYYIRRYFDKSETYGFRLKFSWETMQCFKIYSKPLEEYKYILEKDQIECLQSNILEKINKNDPNLQSGNIYDTKGTVYEMKEIMENMSNDQSEKMDKTNAIATEISYLLSDNQKDLLNTSQIVHATHDTISRIANMVENNFISSNTNELDSIVFEVMPPTRTFTGRLEILEALYLALKGDGISMVSQIAVIAGLGGVGKSELVKKYISMHKKHYNSFIWLNAGTYEILSEEFRDLAKDILYNNRQDKTAYVKKLSIKSIVHDVYKKLSANACLIVFDNVQQFKSQKIYDGGIDQFLPWTIDFINKIFVIITSCNQKWMDIKVIKLDVFSADESKMFIKKVLDIDDEKQDIVITELAETLQHLPLALKQATIYIKEMKPVYENLNRDFSINDYLQKYKEGKQALLDYNFFEQTMDDYKKTVYTTWTITMEAIKRNNTYGSKSIEILELISYLGADNIFISIFTKHLVSEDDKLHFGVALQLLKQFSMVNSDNCKSRFKVHRLVQEVTRINLQNNNRVKIIINKLFNLLNENFTCRYITLDEIFEVEIKVSHLEIFLEHLEELLHKYDLDENYIYKLLLWIADTLLFTHSFENNEKLLSIVERILTMPLYYDVDDVYILKNLPEAYCKFSNHPNKVKVMERCFEIMKHFNKEDCIEMADILRDIFYTLDKKTEICENIIKTIKQIYEKTYGENHVKLLPILEDMVNLPVYNQPQNIHVQIAIYEKILAITINNYGENDYNVYLVLKELNTIYASIPDLQKQRDVLNKMLVIQEKYPEYIIETLVNLGFVYGKLFQKDKQLEVLNKALEIRSKEYGDTHRKVFEIKLLIEKTKWVEYG